MRLKSIVKYYFSDIKNSVIIFYLIIAAIAMLIGCSVTFATESNVEGTIGGGEMATVIFVFIVGLNSFKQNFLFLSVNNIPRTRQFQGFVLSALAVSGIMAAVDTTYASILSEFVNYSSAFMQIYGDWITQTSKPFVIATSFIWSTVLYMAAITGGYLITSLYYRMIKLLKIIVSIGVPVMLSIVLPAVDATLAGGRIGKWLQEVLLVVGGLGNGINPYIAVLSLVVGTAVVAVLSFLLVRKAVVKE
jgi:hypothetical protein